MIRSQLTTPHLIARWSSSSSLPCVSSRRLALFWSWVLPILRPSVSAADFRVRFCRTKTRICPNRWASSSTCSLCVPFRHNTHISIRPLLADFQHRLLESLPLCLLSYSCRSTLLRADPPRPHAHRVIPPPCTSSILSD